MILRLDEPHLKPLNCITA